MKIVQINMCPDGSTGRIMFQIAATAEKSGHEAVSFYSEPFSVRYKKPYKKEEGQKKFSGRFGNAVHYILGTRVGYNGCWSFFSTLNLIRKLKRLRPDILHLHNLHGFCINLPMLISYIRKNKVRTVWTLHDCWLFTGHCPHFDMLGCEKWKTGCMDCPQHTLYPKCNKDRSEYMWRKKREWLSAVPNLTFVTPSEWMRDLVKQSFLKDYPVRVINNGIDLSVFKPTKSNFRSITGCDNKFIVLGVAFDWSDKKGLDVFVELSERLDERFCIVLVGVDDRTKTALPENIITLKRTQNTTELAGIYSAADVFVNPTREENYPGVNMEALACGTPVLTFATGGSPEIPDGNCGYTVEKNDTDELEKQIRRICLEKPYSQEACIKRAESFDMHDRFKEYIRLYEVTSSD